MSMQKNLILAVALGIAGAASLHATPAQARVHVDVYANIAPPPMRVERVPPPRPGYVWAPGYWAWSHHRYNWQRGRWMHERRGYHYSPSRWERDGDRWRYYDSRWDRR